MSGQVVVASGNVDQRPVVAAQACAVLCTPKAAASVTASGSARVTGAEACAASCTAKAPLPITGPAARTPLGCYARIGLRRAW